MLRRVARVPVALPIVIAAVALAALAPTAPARPLRGHVPWSVLLCQFSDQPVQQQPPSYFTRFLTDAGAAQGGVAQYWRTISSGAIDLAGSTVSGWFTMNVTLAQSQAQGKTRASRIDDCVAAAARNGVTPPAGNRILAIINGVVDSGNDGTSERGRVLLDPLAWNNGWAAHEMGHSMGLVAHSFSNDPTYDNSGSAGIGEYDDMYDVMSNAHIFGAAVGPFTPDPPGLTAEYLDREGWLRRNQIVTFGADGSTNRTLMLTDLYQQPSSSGIREIRVPFDPNDLYHYYTIELRIKRGWDGGIPASAVLINEVRRNAAGQPVPFLQLAPTPSRGGGVLGTFSNLAAQSLTANGVTIRVGAIDAIHGTVAVRVASGMADRCRRGFVWREARPTDHVCVVTSIRTDARNDNAGDRIRHLPGSRTCLPGFVWREAFPNDFVCVIPRHRTQARNDNTAAGDRNNPARDVFGPNTCKPGFVWREADLRDWVCVTGQVRDDVTADNAAAASRHVPGSRTCVSGFVWREAFPNDFVCVIPRRRTQARNDNAAASGRLAVP